jgi:hypothetical protein
MRLPKNRGHFWVVRDNEIIDADFPQYRRLRRKFDADPETHCYFPAPYKVQNVIIRLFKRITLKAFDAEDWGEMMEEFMLVAKMTGNADAPTFEKSFTNAIMEIYYHGGNIVFGSMGFKKKDGTYHWYYGHPDCLTVSDFLL